MLNAAVHKDERKPHETLWRLIAKHALMQLELNAASKAIINCSDYQVHLSYQLSLCTAHPSIKACPLVRLSFVHRACNL